MTADDIIKRFNALQTNTYPPTKQQITVNGDDWAGTSVVKLKDVLHLMSWLIAEVEPRRASAGGW